MKGSIKGGAIEQARVVAGRGHRTSMAHKVFNGENLTRNLMGGAQTPIVVLNDNDSVDQGGQYKLIAGPAQPMIVQPSGRIQGGAAKVVYPIDAQGNYDYGFPRSDYAARVLSIERDSLIGFWPQDELAGAISYDASPEQNNGAYTGVTLGQPGIGDGRTVPFFDGATSFNNIYSAGLNADFDGTEGTLLIWGRVTNAGVWTDGISRRLLTIEVDANNYIIIDKGGANSIRGIYRAGGTTETATQAGITTLDYFSFAMSWSVIADEVRYYYNGAWFETDTVLGAWVGPILANRAIIGAANIAPAFPWDGWLGPALLNTAVLTDAQIAYLSTL